MATRGRKPKPVELRVIEGNRGKRKIPSTPKYAPLTEHPPDELPAAGKALWRRLMGEFNRNSTVQRTDREALLALCDLWAIYQDNMALVRRHGTLVAAKNNNADRAAVIVSPAWRVARDALREMEQLWARFGLTPSDRARLVHKDDQPDESPLGRMLSASSGSGG